MWSIRSIPVLDKLRFPFSHPDKFQNLTHPQSHNPDVVFAPQHHTLGYILTIHPMMSTEHNPHDNTVSPGQYHGNRHQTCSYVTWPVFRCRTSRSIATTAARMTTLNTLGIDNALPPLLSQDRSYRSKISSGLIYRNRKLRNRKTTHPIRATLDIPLPRIYFALYFHLRNRDPSKRVP